MLIKKIVRVLEYIGVDESNDVPFYSVVMLFGFIIIVKIIYN
jgi:hypothetical protein